MNKIDEIRRRINSTDPDKPIVMPWGRIVMPWGRDDFNYLLGEIERLQAVVGVAKRLLDGLHDEPDWEGFGPTNVVRYDDVVSLKTALAELEAEHGLASKQDN